MTFEIAPVVMLIVAGIILVLVIVMINRAMNTVGRLIEDARSDLDSRREAVDKIISPIGDSLDKVGKHFEEFQKDKAAIGANLESIARAEENLRKETSNLVQALRQPAVRGKWGEMFLDRVVELAGMQEHCSHDSQKVFSTGSDDQLKPDLVVYLAGSRFIAVDAKAPMSSYLESLEITDEQARIEKLRQHARQIRNRISDLSKKSYWTLFPRSPEFVVLFIPGEVFLTAAIQQDPELIEFGVRARVHLAGPLTLISMLRAAALGWREEQLAENAEEIRRIGIDLYKAASSLAKHLVRVRKSLVDSVESYNDLIGSMERNLLPKARRLQELGAAADEPTIPNVEAIDQLARVPVVAELATTEPMETPRAESA